jgi:hypothetical protein
MQRFRVHKKGKTYNIDQVFLQHDDGEVARGWVEITDLYLRHRYGTDFLKDFTDAFPPLIGAFDTGHTAIEIRKIGDDDPRQHLRGHKTVIARRRIPRGEVLMEYAGYFAFEFEHIRTTQPWRRFDKENKLLECTSASQYDIIVPNDIAEKFCFPPGLHKKQALMIDGNDGKSWVTDILDCRFNPSDFSNIQRILPNCELVELEVMGWPLILCVAVKDIEVGEDLYRDYGPDYWLRDS